MGRLEARALPIALAFTLCVVTPASAVASTIHVTPGSTDERTANQSCSLREAVEAANADNHGPGGDCQKGTGADKIVVPAGHFTFLIPGAGEGAAQTGDLDLTGTLTIVGAGASATTIDANHLDRVFDSLSLSKVTLHRLKITGGKAPDGLPGVD